MSDTLESVYPDLLKTGLDKLRSLDARRELLALFSALEHFRNDLHAQETALEVLQTSQNYIAGLNLFRSTAYWLVEREDLSFTMSFCSPDQDRAQFEAIAGREIKAGRFASALRQNAPVFFQAGNSGQPQRGFFHSLAVSNQVMGMFCGLLHRDTLQAQEISFSLMSLLLGGCADALSALNKAKQLTSQIETLSGLLPLCAWCKKVRNDSGYWEQIDRYISTHSGASITHGVCPECEKKFLAGKA